MKNVSILNFKMNNFAGKWDLISLILWKYPIKSHILTSNSIFVGPFRHKDASKSDFDFGRTHKIRSFATIRDLLAYLQASQINFEIWTCQWHTQFCPKIVQERFSLSQYGPARIFGISEKLQKTKKKLVIKRIFDSLYMNPR